MDGRSHPAHTAGRLVPRDKRIEFAKPESRRATIIANTIIANTIIANTIIANTVIASPLVS